MRQSTVVAADPANVIASEMVTRHFVAQAARPASLTDVALTDLDPDLRMLLFTDGTITRALESRLLVRVRVAVVAELATSIGAEAARCLELPQGSEASHRRVTIGTGTSCPMVYAESLLIFARLPASFVARLRSSRQGIGDALNSGRLESRRELLWFGLGRTPSWSPVAHRSSFAVVRTYRVVIADLAAMLISESFAVQPGPEGYALAIDPVDSLSAM